MPTPAQNRAHVLLEACCTKAQWRSYESTRAIPVVGARTGLRYTIHGDTRNFNVACQDGHVYCAVVDPLYTRVPWEDVLVAQKLLLESDEAAFLRVANRAVNRDGLHSEMARLQRLERWLNVVSWLGLGTGIVYFVFALGHVVGLW